jgi:hypothetical protein
MNIGPILFIYRTTYTAFFMSLNIQCKIAMFSSKMYKSILLK